ncbi:uncharacterized protein LOC100826683 [Brachypodium distachyon]|nr:uncharacterized protein LOC100826683 [Brachypodium distachyon]|eukprot:XP_024319147.1 uncharacterized protein LOC100826683 [Brachypodium distachyon]
MDADGVRTRSPSAAAAAMESVLGDDDLLREILRRLHGSPASLVRAALVCKRWLRLASDRAFLRAFRPRTLVGFFAYRSVLDFPRFVPLLPPHHQQQEEEEPLRRCLGAFADAIPAIKDCRNGRLLLEFSDAALDRRLAVLTPLPHSRKPPHTSVLPPAPPPHPQEAPLRLGRAVFLPEHGGGHDGIMLVSLRKDGRNVSADVHVLRSGGWVGPRTTAPIELPAPLPGYLSIELFDEMLPPLHGKIFIKTNEGYIVGLDLATTRLFILELPPGVLYRLRLSYAEDSSGGLYLVNSHGFQLSVWLLRSIDCGGGAGGGSWVLVDTFDVREGCDLLVDDNWVPKDGDRLEVIGMGDNAEYVFLNHVASGGIIYVHLRRRVVEKVFQVTRDVASWPYVIHVSPFVDGLTAHFPASVMRMDMSQKSKAHI